MLHLCATTDLERGYRINLNIIGLNRKPQVKNLRLILKEWLDYRIETVQRRLQCRLAKVLEQIHILTGLRIVYLNLDEVIRLIREEDKPKAALMKKFKLSEIQADAILDLKLRRLDKLEEDKIKAELEKLQQEKETLEKILASKRRLKALVRKEIEADTETHGDERKSPFKEGPEAKVMSENTLLPVEHVTIVLSRKGWVRSAKGHQVDPETLNYKTGDALKQAGFGKSDQPVIFIDSGGRCYALPAHSLASARSFGEPVSARLNPPDGATFEGLMTGGPESVYLLGSDAGYGFMVRLGDIHTKNRNGKAVLSVPTGAKVLPPVQVNDIKKDRIAVVSSTGRLLIFPINQLTLLPKGKGLKIIHIPPAKLKTGEESVTAMTIIGPTDNLLIHTDKTHMTINSADQVHYSGERGRRGNMISRNYRKVARLRAEPTGKA